MKYFSDNLKFLRKTKGLKQAEIEASTGIERTTWSNYETGKSRPNLELFHKISLAFGVNEYDLLNTDLSNVGLIGISPISKSRLNVGLNVGVNVGLKSKNDDKSDVLSVVNEPDEAKVLNLRMPKVITIDTQGNENVVMVPVKARAGYLNGYADPKFIENLPAYRLPGLNNGTFRLFEVGGRSMYPTLNDGDMVIGSYVEQLRDTRNDRLYVVVTKTEGVVVKRILNRLENDGKLILKSDNYKDRDEFPTMVIDPQDILEIWYVTGFISRQMRPPSEMYNRLIDLEGRLTLMEEQNRKRLKEN